MDKYTKAVLTVIALCVLALPVRAEEKVWYCQMTGLAQTTIEGGEIFKEQRFTMKVTRTSVAFASSGWFEDVVMPITEFFSVDYFLAGTEFSRVFYENNIFNFAAAFDTYSVAITARCDDF